MKVNENRRSVRNQRCSETDGEADYSYVEQDDMLDASNDDLKKNASQLIANSMEFYELISRIDPEASQDRFYATSPQFVEARLRLRKELRQAFWLAIGLCVVLISISVVTYY